jgi:hypothetical protein
MFYVFVASSCLSSAVPIRVIRDSKLVFSGVDSLWSFVFVHSSFRALQHSPIFLSVNFLSKIPFIHITVHGPLGPIEVLGSHHVEALLPKP